MKKAALLFAVLGSIFFAACAKEESKTVETTEEVTTPDGDTQQTNVEATVTTETQQ